LTLNGTKIYVKQIPAPPVWACGAGFDLNRSRDSTVPHYRTFKAKIKNRTTSVKWGCCAYSCRYGRKGIITSQQL